MRSRSTAALALLVGAGSSACSDEAPQGPASSGTSSSGGTGANGGSTGGCEPGATETCYDGPEGTSGVGVCASGERTCGPDGTWGSCDGQVLPQADSCASSEDEDCDGVAAECLCMPGSSEACYSGPSGTDGVGICMPGSRVCDDSGLGWGPCSGETIPAAEDCSNPEDEDCSGLACSEALWAKLFGDADESQWVNAIAADASGNVYITGQLGGSADFGGGVLTSTGSSDVFIAKLDPQGNHVWSKSFPDVGTQEGTDIAVTPGGDVVIVGQFYPSITFDGSVHLSEEFWYSAFVASLDTNGTYKWSASLDSIPSDETPKVEFDSAGNALVALTWFDGNLPTSKSHARALKYAPNGAVVWDKTFGDSFDQDTAGVAVAAADNVILFGEFIGSMDFGGAGTLYSTSGGAHDLFVAKLTSAGVPIWAARLGGTDSEWSAGISVDAADSILLHGGFYGTVDFGTGPMTALDASDPFVLKLSSSGGVTWAKQLDSLGSYAIATDGNLDVVVAGAFSGTVNLGGADLPNGGSMFLLKLDPDGAHVWSKSYGDTASSLAAAPHALAVDASNHILLGGWATAGVDLGTGPLQGVNSDLFVAKLAP